MTSTRRDHSRVRTQTDQVLNYLRNNGPLDQFTAKDELGVLRLGARIWDLKQRGYAIRTELIEAPTEYGGTRIAQYSLLREAAASAARPASRSSEVDPTTEVGSAGPPAPSEELRNDLSRAEPRTLDDALWTFGDRSSALGVSPTVREYQSALGAASESVAHRWLRVLEREGYLELNDQLGGMRARSWRVTSAGYERLYVLERTRRLALETGLARRVAAEEQQRGSAVGNRPGGTPTGRPQVA